MTAPSNHTFTKIFFYVGIAIHAACYIHDWQIQFARLLSLDDKCGCIKKHALKGALPGKYVHVF